MITKTSSEATTTRTARMSWISTTWLSNLTAEIQMTRAWACSSWSIASTPTAGPSHTSLKIMWMITTRFHSSLRWSKPRESAAYKVKSKDTRRSSINSRKPSRPKHRKESEWRCNLMPRRTTREQYLPRYSNCCILRSLISKNSWVWVWNRIEISKQLSRLKKINRCYRSWSRRTMKFESCSKKWKSCSNRKSKWIQIIKVLWCKSRSSWRRSRMINYRQALESWSIQRTR